MSDDLALLTEAARAAGKIALRYWRKSPENWEKEAGAGPVSEADLAVDAMLKHELGTARPDYGWLSEETPDTDRRLGADRVFIIDPIDGTRAFLEGTPDFAHSLAVAEGGVVTAAVVYLPAQNRLYSATNSTISMLDGGEISCSARAQVEGARVLTARPNLHPEHWKDGLPPPVERKFRSSLAWRLCLVAEGAYDGMLTLRPTWEWDIAAGSLIAAQAGAAVSDRRGAALRFNSAQGRLDGCLAAPLGLHRALLTQLRQD